MGLRKYTVMAKALQEEWDEIYRNYALNEIPWHTDRPDRNLVELIKKKRIRKGSVLDMCSGDGTNSIYLASKGFKVYGVDISPTAVKIAKARCAEKKQHCNYFAGNVLTKRLNKKFDFIFDRGCFHHISKKDKPRYVKRLYALLKKGGKVYVQCFSDKNPPFWKNLSKKDIYKYFSGYFNIIYIKEAVHAEPGTGWKRYFYCVFMEKKE